MGRMSDARERLLSSAGELIYALGSQGASVEELCERAGVKKGSFYHFFPSKQELTLAALEAQWNMMRDALVEPAFRGLGWTVGRTSTRSGASVCRPGSRGVPRASGTSGPAGTARPGGQRLRLGGWRSSRPAVAAEPRFAPGSTYAGCSASLLGVTGFVDVSAPDHAAAAQHGCGVGGGFRLDRLVRMRSVGWGGRLRVHEAGDCGR